MDNAISAIPWGEANFSYKAWWGIAKSWGRYTSPMGRIYAAAHAYLVDGDVVVTPQPSSRGLCQASVVEYKREFPNVL